MEKLKYLEKNWTFEKCRKNVKKSEKKLIVTKNGTFEKYGKRTNSGNKKRQYSRKKLKFGKNRW